MASQLVVRDIETKYQVETDAHLLFILVKERLLVALATSCRSGYREIECQRARKVDLTADLS
jgi:hypothetical protein